MTADCRRRTRAPACAGQFTPSRTRGRLCERVAYARVESGSTAHKTDHRLLRLIGLWRLLVSPRFAESKVTGAAQSVSRSVRLAAQSAVAGDQRSIVRRMNVLNRGGPWRSARAKLVPNAAPVSTITRVSVEANARTAQMKTKTVSRFTSNRTDPRGTDGVSTRCSPYRPPLQPQRRRLPHHLPRLLLQHRALPA